MGAALILMCGRSFSGKSTVAQRIAEALEVEIVGLDSINEERGLAGGEGIPIEEWVRANQEAARRVLLGLKSGKRMLVDDTNSPRFIRDDWRAVAASEGAGFVLVYVDSPEHIIRERLASNRKDLVRHDVADAVMDKHLEDFEPPDILENPLTTSSSTVDMSSLFSAIHRAIS